MQFDHEAYADACARDLARNEFVGLTPEQRAQIHERAQLYRAVFRAHPHLHNALSVALLAGLFLADAYVLLALPAQLGVPEGGLGRLLAVAAITGALHGFLVCNIVTYTVHEGAAHNLIIQGQGRTARALRWLAHNACRFFLADPEYYTQGHGAHHRDLGTPDDGSFTQAVRGRRLLRALLPMAPFFSGSDYFPWRPQERTPSRARSVLLTNLYVGAFATAMTLRFGPLFMAVALLLIGNWLSFVLDRLRESVEHLHMPLDRELGTRELGLGLWGLLLGGGPWGQPCHLSHHLAPALPWYLQLCLHADLCRILTPAQRRQFFAAPVVGVPGLLWSIAFPRRSAP